MNTVKKTGLSILLAALLALSATAQITAQDKPVELSADTIEYDSVQGIMVAQGSVKIVRDNAVLTGSNAEYNTKTKEALVTGGVKAVKDKATLTAAEVRSYDDNHLTATGDVVVIQGENRLTGPKMDYFADKDYAVVPENGKLFTADGVMSADTMKAFFKEDRAEGEGHVHLVSDTRKLDAVSDHAVYYGAKNPNGDKAVLTGNARAVQNGNVLTGNVLTIYMDDKQMDAQGRTKLIIQPQSQPSPAGPVQP